MSPGFNVIDSGPLLNTLVDNAYAIFIARDSNLPYVNVVVILPFGSSTVAIGALNELVPYRCSAASRDRGSPDGTTNCSPVTGVIVLPSGFGAFGSFGLAAISNSISLSS